jgi:hypothetical protein
VGNSKQQTYNTFKEQWRKFCGEASLPAAELPITLPVNILTKKKQLKICHYDYSPYISFKYDIIENSTSSQLKQTAFFFSKFTGLLAGI